MGSFPLTTLLEEVGGRGYFDMAMVFVGPGVVLCVGPGRKTTLVQCVRAYLMPGRVGYTPEALQCISAVLLQCSYSLCVSP